MHSLGSIHAHRRTSLFLAGVATGVFSIVAAAQSGGADSVVAITSGQIRGTVLAGGRAGMGLSPKQIGQRQRAGGQGPDLQEVAPRNSVTIALFFTEDGEHGLFPLWFHGRVNSKRSND